MLQMLTQEKIDQFYKDVDSLGLKKKRNATIQRATGFPKSNISEWLRKKKVPSENFIDTFYDKFKEILTNGSTNVPRSTISDKGVNLTDSQLNTVLPLGELKVTLKDYIDLLKQTNAELVNIINSTLSQIHSDQRAVLAHEKAWVEWEAEKEAGGNEQKKQELMYKMNTLVHGKLGGKPTKGSPAETGK